MITYHYLTDFELNKHSVYTDWIINCVQKLSCTLGNVEYIFCSDDDLLDINRRYLNHDYYTDIITFPYEAAPNIGGDIYISVDRVMENATTYQETFEAELRRVMIHGILHLAGFNDKTETQKKEMREKENELIKLFHVKH